MLLSQQHAMAATMLHVLRLGASSEASSPTDGDSTTKPPTTPKPAQTSLPPEHGLAADTRPASGLKLEEIN